MSVKQMSERSVTDILWRGLAHCLPGKQAATLEEAPRARDTRQTLAAGALLTLFIWLVAPPPVGAQRELMVSAAASLTQAFKESGTEFERLQSGTSVVFNFAASDILVRQIIEGAPVDIFASADEEAMDKAGKENAIDPATRFNFAANRLVLIVSSDFRGSLASLEDLRRDPIKRIAIGQPATVPAGRYARAALEQAGLWDRLRDKFIYTQNVRQTLDYVMRGETDAGFVYATDLLIAKDKAKLALETPTPRPIVYPVAITRRSRNKKLAGEFLAFLRSDSGRKILLKNGFAVPPS